MKGSSLFRRGVLAFFLLSAVRIGLAQGDTARLQGTVIDPQGAAVVGATLIVPGWGLRQIVSPLAHSA